MPTKKTTRKRTNKTAKEIYEEQLRKTEIARQKYLDSLPPHSEEYRNARYEKIQEQRGNGGKTVLAIIIYVFYNIIFLGILAGNNTEMNTGTAILIFVMELIALMFAGAAYD